MSKVVRRSSGVGLTAAPPPAHANDPDAETISGMSNEAAPPCAGIHASITVAVRKRPLIHHREDGENDIVRCEMGSVVTVFANKLRVDLTPLIEPQSFSFDYVFDDSSSNEDVYYNTTRPLLDTVRKGGSAVVFAYGQTGSGKTHTMLGKDEHTKGIYGLAMTEMLTMAHDTKRLTVSFYEVYGSKLWDLLNERMEVKLLQDEYKNVHVVGLKEIPVDSVEDLSTLMTNGQNLRAVGATSANDRSSRSHAVLAVNLKGLDNEEIFGRITFVDLAGSERAADTMDSDKKTRLEGAEINKSLLALKECIRAMGLKKRHIPFRGSKLTQILRDSFIGYCHTCVIANISPCQSHCEDTLNTLRYADRIKELRNEGMHESSPPIPCISCGQPVFVGIPHVCRKVLAQCPHCRKEIDKSRLDQHLAECSQAVTRCVYCNERVTQGDAARHRRVCSRAPMKCPQCEAKVPRNGIDKHLKFECKLAKAQCRYCRLHFVREELVVHEPQCPSMQVVCRYCGMAMKQQKLEAHTQECPSRPPHLANHAHARFRALPPKQNRVVLEPIDSNGATPGSRRVVLQPHPPNSSQSTPVPLPLPPPRSRSQLHSSTPCKYCGRQISNANADAHRAECPYLPIACPYSSHGCHSYAPRSQMTTHLLTSASEHVALLEKYTQRIQRESDELRSKVAALEKRTAASAGEGNGVKDTVEVLR